MAIYQMRFELGRPRYRAIDVRLETDQPILQLSASSAPRDSIAELAGAVVLMLKGGAAATVVWNGAPTEYEFSFSRDGDAVLFCVSRWPDSRRPAGAGKELLRARGKPMDVCLPFWRGLQRLQSQVPGSEYKLAWGHPLPTAKLAELTALVQQSRSRA